MISSSFNHAVVSTLYSYTYNIDVAMLGTPFAPPTSAHFHIQKSLDSHAAGWEPHTVTFLPPLHPPPHHSIAVEGVSTTEEEEQCIMKVELKEDEHFVEEFEWWHAACDGDIKDAHSKDFQPIFNQK
jgi:hypothetical protein